MNLGIRIQIITNKHALKGQSHGAQKYSVLKNNGLEVIHGSQADEVSYYGYSYVDVLVDYS